ncbi:MAG: transcription antitermination factor NusB [Clostridia bacterium]|nr:transcription antitermination factor NusB [Clostridia bacterium]
MGKRIESRQKERVAAMKMVYEWSMGGDGGVDTLNMIYEAEGSEQVEAPVEAEASRVEQTVQGVIDRVQELDEQINAHSVGWKTDRMPKVDLAILRLGLYELLLRREPVPVVINEAVELANIYCGEKSGAFINGVLGAISREVQQK